MLTARSGREDGSSPARPAARPRVRAPLASVAIPLDADAVESAEARLARRRALILDCVALVLDQPDLARAQNALVDVLRLLARSDRVALAMMSHTGLKLVAISQQPLIDAAAAESRLLVDAMEEAQAAGAIVRWPEPVENGRTGDGTNGNAFGGREAHRMLSGRRDGMSVVSVPLYRACEPVAAILFETRDAGPDRQQAIDALPSVLEPDMLEALACALAGPLAWRVDAERGLRALLADRWRAALARLGDRQRPARLAGTLALVGLLAAAAIVPIERQLVADARVVPVERRVVGVPLDGFIDSIDVRIGQRVRAGDRLASLDTRELELDRAQARTRQLDAEAASRAAMAVGDRSAMALAQADLTRAHARLELIDRQRARAELLSPIDGTVIAGDPSQARGRPVLRGETLLEIAPDAGLEVHLLIDESDIADAREGQSGQLALTASPGSRLALTIASIHPVAETGDGSSRFRARAAVELGGADLRPGQTGVARLPAGTTTLLGRWFSGSIARWARWRWATFG